VAYGVRALLRACEECNAAPQCSVDAIAGELVDENNEEKCGATNSMFSAATLSCGAARSIAYLSRKSVIVHRIMVFWLRLSAQLRLPACEALDARGPAIDLPPD